MEENIIPSPQSFTLRYSIQRHELWSWYWSTWRRADGLWQYWLLFLVVIMAPALALGSLPQLDMFDCLLAGALAYIIAMCVLVVFPQLHYKPRERTLVVNETGIETTVGTSSARRAWSDISYISDRENYIALVVATSAQLKPFSVWIRMRNGNAFIVPDRAFANKLDRNTFKDSVVAWHEKNALRFPRFANSPYYAPN